MNLFLSVRFRLFALCATLLGVLGGANLFLGHIIQQHEERQLQQQEQFLRVETIHAAQRALTNYRRWWANRNAAVLGRNPELQPQSEAEVAKAEDDLLLALHKVEPFDPSSVKVIRNSLAVLPDVIRRGIQAVLEQDQDASRQLIAETTRHLDTIEETLYAGVRRELALAHEAEERERKRSDTARRISIIVVGASSVVGLFVLWLTLRSIIRPLQTTVAAIRRVNAGETELDLPPISRDEFGDMAVALRQFRDTAERLRRLAFRDPLTGLGNRVQLEESLRTAIDGCRAAGGHLALMYVDLDNFRTVNDSLGHSAGDRYLCEAALRLQRFASEEALVCRYSGDKFTVLLKDLPSDGLVDQIRATAGILLRGLSEPFPLGEHLLPMSVSIGVACYPADGETSEQLVSSADAAMYRAKRIGRNTVQFASPEFTAGARKQLAIAADIRRGLDAGEFEAFYQPVVDITSGEVIAAEALMRWRHPQRGIVLAGEFIPAAEDTGLIHVLGERCLLQASEQSTRWSQGDHRLRVSVNLSARQIEDGTVVRVLEELHTRKGHASAGPSSLDFEITETAILEQIPHTEATLERVKSFGHRLGVDDFGTGYSSLAYLQRYPVDRIKIDRSFVARVDSSREAQAIVSATVALAKSLNLEVIAEGVETRAQVDRLEELGCTLQQGFYFTPALPVQEFESWLLSQRERPRGWRDRPV